MTCFIAGVHNINLMIGVKTVCISHCEDADGLICAALLRRLKDASTILATYDEFEDALKSIQPPVQELYICDLNIREDLLEEVLRIKGFAVVVFVDHHPTAEGVLDRLKLSGATVVHSPMDCASALLYDHFIEDLGREGARLAAYAAVSDQFEDGPIASRLLSRLDRHFVQHEASILTHALHRVTTAEFRASVVEELSDFKFPHRIKGANEAAFAHLENVAGLIEILPKRASRLGRVAYVGAISETSIGSVAGLLVDAMEVDVGVCYKSGNKNTMNISIRGRRGLKLHLGEVTRGLAVKYGGFGGGHKRASGASIPAQSYMKFIRDLEDELEGAEDN